MFSRETERITKTMPYKDPKKERECCRRYYKKHRDEILARNKEYYRNHRDEILAQYDKDKVLSRNKEYYQNNRKKILSRIKEYRKNHRDETSVKQKEYYKKHRNKILAKQKEYQKTHRNIENEYYKKKIKTDLRFNLSKKISSGIRNSLKNQKGGTHWEKLVGYSVTNLKKHLELNIPKGYTWQDFLEGKLHIDHIIPISAFNFNKPEHPDFKRCWALENLQLLPAEENLRKHNKLIRPFQPALKIALER